MSKSNILKICNEEIDKRINMKLLGNSNRGMKEFAIDLLNNSDSDIETIAAGTCLHKTTIRNLMNEVTKHPRYDTVERVYKYFEIDLQAKQVRIAPRFQNKPKGK